MDSETANRFDRLEQKIDDYTSEMRTRFHGERGDNGVYGRLQSLEHWRGSVQRHVKGLWTLLVSSLSGLTTWLIGRG